MLHRGDISVEFVRHRMRAGSAGQRGSPGMGRHGRLHMPAVYIVENDCGHPVSRGFKPFPGVPVHGPVGVIHAPIEFHVREDIDDLRDFFLFRARFDRRLQNQVKDRFQVRAAAPGQRADKVQLVPQIPAADTC